jgi:hypothetical protein
MSLWSWLTNKFPGRKPTGKPVQVESDDLEASLRAAETRGQREQQYGPTISLLIDRYAGLKIEVYADEHPPPHFHVRCAAGEASFRISDGAMLNGSLRSEARMIKAWHAKNKSKIVNAWNKSRPTNCSVGKYREN